MEIKRILVVDDEPNINYLLKEILSEKYYVVAVRSGKEAVEKAKEEDFDVAFIDVVMPEMDGIETLKAIKETKPAIVAIMMTGYAVEKDIKEAIKISAFDYLYKPFTKEDVHSTLKKIVEKEQLKIPPKEYIARKKRRFIPIAPTKKKLQFKYIRLTTLSILIPLLIVIAGFYVIFHLTLGTAQLGRYAEARLKDVFSSMNYLLLGVTVISILIAGYFSIHLSHKIAGPLYRIEQTIREIINGSRKEFKIRKKDELQELVTLLNDLLKKILPKK